MRFADFYENMQIKLIFDKKIFENLWNHSQIK